MNRSNSGASFDVIHIFFDALVHVVSFFLAYSFWGRDIYTGEQWKAFTTVYLAAIVVFLLCNRALYIYNSTIFFYLDRIIKRESFSFLVAFICAFLIFMNATELPYERNFLAGLTIVTYVLLILQILVFQKLIDRFIMRKHVPRVLYVGSKDSYNKFRYFLQKTSILVNEIGYISLEDYDGSLEYIGSLSDLEAIIRKYNIDQVFFLQKREMDIKSMQEYIDICIEMGITCRIIVDTFRRRKAFSYISSIGTYPVYTFHTVTMNMAERVVKRIFDILFSFVAIVITSPIMLLTAIAIKLDSKGPALFKQVRVGKNGRHFKIWKFRSMYQNAEEMKSELMEFNEVEDGMMFKIKDDPRITRVGKFIRRTSIDELPQFFNVLAGSMSIVGTRPPTIDEVKKYSTKQWRRISIKPGITGMWQTNGRSSVTDFNEVVELDTKYIDEWTLWLDVKIILKTFSEVLFHRNSY